MTLFFLPLTIVFHSCNLISKISLFSADRALSPYVNRINGKSEVMWAQWRFIALGLTCGHFVSFRNIVINSSWHRFHSCYSNRKLRNIYRQQSFPGLFFPERSDYSIKCYSSVQLFTVLLQDSLYFIRSENSVLQSFRLADAQKIFFRSIYLYFLTKKHNYFF